MITHRKQDLNNGHDWFNFRGWVNTVRGRDILHYEVVSKWCLGFNINRGGTHSVGLGFCKIYFSLIYLNKLLRPFKHGREYGIYLQNDTLPAHGLRISPEIAITWSYNSGFFNGGNKKGYRKLIDLKSAILGAGLSRKDRLDTSHAYFKINDHIYYAEVSSERSTHFRTRIPYALHNWRTYRGEVEIKNRVPDQHAGKGENDWDIDDDATHAISYGIDEEDYKKYEGHWNRTARIEWQCREYFNTALYGVKRYGNASNSKIDEDSFEFLGFRKPEGFKE